MDDLISVTCHLAQNFASQGWATKEGASKSQIPLEDVLGVMYGSVDVFSRHTIAWEPVSAEEGNLDHPPGTSRPDTCASATQGVVKPDRATANRAPGAPGKDEALWELMYFFDNMDNPAGAPRKETGDPRFTRQHLVATFMDLILFARGLVAPRAHVPSRAYEVLAPSLTVPLPAQFFQGIAEQGYVWQNVPYGIDFTGDIGVYGRSGMFRSWGKAHDGRGLRHCVTMTRTEGSVLCACAQNLPMSADGNTRGAMASLHDLTRVRRASGADARISGVLPLFQAAGFPTCTGLAADTGIQAYVADPQPPLPACTAAGEAHASPRSAVGALHWHINPPEEGLYCPPPAPTGPSSAGRPARDAAPLWLPVGWPNVRIPDTPDPLLSSPAPTPRLHPTCGQTCVVELPPPRHARSPLPARRLSKQARSASGGPPGEDAQAVRSSEPHPIAGGRPTPPFDTLDSALLHVVQHAARSGGLSPGERECVVARLCGMPALPQGFLGVVAHLRSLADQTSLAPWDFNPHGDGVLPWLLPWAHVLISWVREDMHVAPGSDHRGVIVNMYLELSRTEWWALSDRREVLSEWCKGASMLGVNVRPGVRVTVRVCSNGWLLQ
ncbi:hypothetical protein K439DRAFT_1618921 [Ramaria rubella]|nr:hypothetical protein K439DRAFT_1618921 [Ramaria rubella]